MTSSRSYMVQAGLVAVIAVAVLLFGIGFHSWQFLITVALAKGMVALGAVLLLCIGLASFGQGLFYCVGAYSVGMTMSYLGVGGVVLWWIGGGDVGIPVTWQYGVRFCCGKDKSKSSVYSDIFISVIF